MFESSKFKLITMYVTRDCLTEVDKLKTISQRYCVPHAFYSLRNTSWLGGIHWCTPWETLKEFDQRLISYITEYFHDILGDKTAGKKKKDLFNK